ncbi:MAG: ATPase domain-containing protein [Candidatus Thermoplasmatota archaeon]
MKIKIDCLYCSYPSSLENQKCFKNVVDILKGIYKVDGIKLCGMIETEYFGDAIELLLMMRDLLQYLESATKTDSKIESICPIQNCSYLPSRVFAPLTDTYFSRFQSFYKEVAAKERELGSGISTMPPICTGCINSSLNEINSIKRKLIDIVVFSWNSAFSILLDKNEDDLLYKQIGLDESRILRAIGKIFHHWKRWKPRALKAEVKTQAMIEPPKEQMIALDVPVKESEKELKKIIEMKDAEIKLLIEKTTELEEKLEKAKLSKPKTELEAQVRKMEKEIEILKEKLDMKEKEIDRISEPLKFKEESMLRREEELKYREELLEKEFKKLELVRADIDGTDIFMLKKQLEELDGKLREKEEEIKIRESYLRMKEEELRLKSSTLVEEEIERRAAERELEFKSEKVKTGNSRLDDLLLGGIPVGSNVLVSGTPFIGKETLLNCFIVDGIKKGIPGLIVTVDISPMEIKAEMKYLLPIIEEYEKIGLIKFVDAYTETMGIEEKEEHVEYVSNPGDFKGINNAIEKISAEFKDKYPTYRFIIRSISTLVTYSDITSTYKFLQSLTGRLKRAKIVSLYALEQGMHTEAEIETLNKLMDGRIEMKAEGIKTYLRVHGICDVQSRAWIQYTYSKKWVNIGSFTLDHIR